MAEPGAAAFNTTHWSLIRLAGSGSSPDALAALGSLFRAYWYPAYAHARRCGQDPASAQDIVQDVFYALLSNDQLAAVGPGRGRFRSHLLAAINHHIANEWHRGRRQKRGGGSPHIALDSLEAEERFALEPTDHRTPETLFDHQWALTVLDRATARLRREWETAGKAQAFDQLQPYLAGDHQAPPQNEVAARLGLGEGAIRVAIHRMRRRYRELVRDEIAPTVAGEDEIEDEIRHLMIALRSVR